MAHIAAPTNKPIKVATRAQAEIPLVIDTSALDPGSDDSEGVTDTSDMSKRDVSTTLTIIHFAIFQHFSSKLSKSKLTQTLLSTYIVVLETDIEADGKQRGDGS